MSERRGTDMSRERKLDWLSNPRPMAFYCRKNLLRSAMAIEYEIKSKNADLDLKALSVTMSERGVTDMSRERKLDWLSNPRPMALLQKESFA